MRWPIVERLGHVDLHVRDVLAVPDRFEEAVREPEGQDVERRFLAEEVVDAEDLLLVERRVQRLVELHRADARSVPNGFSMMMRARVGEPGLAEQAHHLGRGRRAAR